MKEEPYRPARVAMFDPARGCGALSGLASAREHSTLAWFQGRLSFLRGIRVPVSAAHSPSSAQDGTGGPVARMSCRGPFNELAII